jgi:uncharacterized protein
MQNSQADAGRSEANGSTVPVGRIVEMWRYPVKSLAGEALQTCEVTDRGFHGDRSFGIIDASDGFLLSAKRLPKLLEGSAWLLEDDSVEISFDGETHRSSDPDIDATLSQWLGRAVRLSTPRSGKRAHVEIEVDIDDPTQIAEFSTRPGLFHDGSVMHILSAESLRHAKLLYPAGEWSTRRFRPNVLIEAFEPPEESGFVDDAWVGHTATVSGAQFAVHKLCDRCVMVTRATGDLPADKMILRTLHRHHGSDLGVKAHVVAPGTISIGDEFFLDPTIN